MSKYRLHYRVRRLPNDTIGKSLEESGGIVVPRQVPTPKKRKLSIFASFLCYFFELPRTLIQTRGSPHPIIFSSHIRDTLKNREPTSPELRLLPCRAQHRAGHDLLLWRLASRIRRAKIRHGLRDLRMLSLIHIWRCRRSYACRSRWSPYH